MTAEQNPSSTDPGLTVLVALLRFQGIGADPEQVRHRLGMATIGVPEMLRYAKELGLKAKVRSSTWERLATTAQPSIAVLGDGGYVPTDSRLEVEANLNNRDIGFVQVGHDAEIKVDTFNFTKYGLLHGKVLSLSQDAIEREKPVDKSGDKPRGAEDSSSEPLGQELVFSARVSLDRTQMQVDDRVVNLSPGMAVTVEIKTGSRRMIEYLLSPLLKYRQESLRDR